MAINHSSIVPSDAGRVKRIRSPRPRNVRASRPDLLPDQGIEARSGVQAGSVALRPLLPLEGAVYPALQLDREGAIFRTGAGAVVGVAVMRMDVARLGN